MTRMDGEGGGMDILWTSEEAARATGGEARMPWWAGGVAIDSRTLRPGDLFVALRDRRDGHDFVAAALAGGAGAALVSRVPAGVADDAPLLIVPDVLAALSALAGAARARTRARVAAITGSAGKTSTKDMLARILAPLGPTHVAEASFNNHWGVPLTLARLPRDARFAVIEIGMNHPGEIAPLARLARPDAALITTVTTAHMAAFSSLDAIAREKGAIFDGLAPGGAAIINADIDTAPLLLDLARAREARAITFGRAAGARWRLADIRAEAGRLIVRATAGGAPVSFALATLAEHFAHDALGALAAAEALGADPGAAVAALDGWAPLPGRGAREHVRLNDDGAGFELIDDAYNANPASLAGALAALAASSPAGGNRIAILGDMLELGTEEEALHRAIARDPAIARITTVHCVGPRMRALHDALPDDRRGAWAATADELAEHVETLVRAGDIVLVKGSHGSRVGIIVDALRKLGQGGPDRERAK